MQYAHLIGQPVTLRVRVGALRIPLRGRLLAETPDTLQLEITDNWQLPVHKDSLESIMRDTQSQAGAR